jgi:hypothetical protein
MAYGENGGNNQQATREMSGVMAMARNVSIISNISVSMAYRNEWR